MLAFSSSVVSSASCESAKDENMVMPGKEEPCDSASFISEEINALISAWERCDISANTAILERQDINDHFSKAGDKASFDPPRRIHLQITVPTETLPSPARFYRKKNTCSQ